MVIYYNNKWFCGFLAVNCLFLGNSNYVEEVEWQIAEFHSGHSALLFNSGYMANLSLLSSLPQLDQIVLCDALVHNSVKEGLHLSRATVKVIIHVVIDGKNITCIFFISVVPLRVGQEELWTCTHISFFFFRRFCFCFCSCARMVLVIPTQ